jgi:hypothetical protein
VSRSGRVGTRIGCFADKNVDAFGEKSSETVERPELARQTATPVLPSFTFVARSRVVDANPAIRNGRQVFQTHRDVDCRAGASQRLPPTAATNGSTLRPE